MQNSVQLYIYWLTKAQCNNLKHKWMLLNILPILWWTCSLKWRHYFNLPTIQTKQIIFIFFISFFSPHYHIITTMIKLSVFPGCKVYWKHAKLNHDKCILWWPPHTSMWSILADNFLESGISFEQQATCPSSHENFQYWSIWISEILYPSTVNS